MIARRAVNGFTMIELMIALTLSGIFGVIVTKILVTTSRFYGKDSAQRNARQVARGAFGLIESELRMIDTRNGVVSADSFTLTVRVPYAFGILCTTGGSTATASLLPMDSLTFAGAGFSGYAWRDSTSGLYTAVETGVTTGTGTASVCTGQSITTLTGGKVVTLSPAPPATVTAGSAVYLYRRVTYRFAASAVLPGRRALWRDVPASALTEELVTPFDATARFRFYVLNADTAQNAVPSPLGNLRGIELVLNGASEQTPLGRTAPATANLNTAVFFRNRVD